MPDDSTPGREPAPRDLADILRDLERVSGAPTGVHGELRDAVGQLSRSLATLLDGVRTERAQQRARIAELEAELAKAQARLAELGEQPAGPAPDDFEQLRAAAEQLRLRTEELMREAVASGPQTPPQDDAEQAAEPVVSDGSADEGAEAPPAEEVEAPAPQAVLKVFPGTPAPLRRAAALPVESDLDLAAGRARNELADVDADLELDADDLEDDLADGLIGDDPGSLASSDAPAARREPIALSPRAPRRRKRWKRRRVDARKLEGVEPTTALRAMVDAIDPLWTAGHPLDLVIALTDGGTLHVHGGDTEPLQIDDVAAGTQARTTLTATRDQLLPLFGRLELTDEQSAPLLHGGRVDADLLVGWIDRAQRLEPDAL